CGGSAGLPGVEVALGEVFEADSACTGPGHEVDGDGDGLLGPEEGAAAGAVGLVHPAQAGPADEAGDDLTVVWVGESIDGTGSPVVEAVKVEVLAGERTVFDQEPANVVARPGGRQRVQQLVGDVAVAADLFEERAHVGLLDPGQAAVGSLHVLHGFADGDELGCGLPGDRVGQHRVHNEVQLAVHAASTAI